MNYKVIKNSNKSLARLGVLKTAHGNIKTPLFMPVATKGSLKSLTSLEVEKLGAQVVLSNCYHLFLRPGLKILKKVGGLHKFMDWSKPILTDSGGFQVFSLLDEKNKSSQGGLVKVTDSGVEFKSVYDGSKHLFTPRSVIKMQAVFGSDIMMVLDQCLANPASHVKAKEAVVRTLKWAKQSLKVVEKLKSKQALFGIVQGSLYKDLRQFCAYELSKMNFGGYAIGGLAVGESPNEMYQVLDYTVSELPQTKPRYLMGVGYPEQIVESVKRGIDMFDCVIPTREARHGRLYIRNNEIGIMNKGFYKTINIKSEKFAKSIEAISPNSDFPELRKYTKAYLRHLFSVNELLALRLATLNNLEFYFNLMKIIREEIKNNKL